VPKNSLTLSIHDLARGLWRPSLPALISSSSFEQLFLARGEIDRSLHHDVAHQIAILASSAPLDAFAAQPKDLPGLSLRRDLDLADPSSVGISISPPSAAVEMLIGISHVQIVVIAREDRMLPDMKSRHTGHRRVRRSCRIRPRPRGECDRLRRRRRYLNR
jgi:hypothetical protein